MKKSFKANVMLLTSALLLGGACLQKAHCAYLAILGITLSAPIWRKDGHLRQVQPDMFRKKDVLESNGELSQELFENT